MSAKGEQVEPCIQNCCPPHLGVMCCSRLWDHNNHLLWKGIVTRELSVNEEAPQVLLGDTLTKGRAEDHQDRLMATLNGAAHSQRIGINNVWVALRECCQFSAGQDQVAIAISRREEGLETVGIGQLAVKGRVLASANSRSILTAIVVKGRAVMNTGAGDVLICRSLHVENVLDSCGVVQEVGFDMSNGNVLAQACLYGDILQLLSSVRILPRQNSFIDQCA